jgi:S-adenosylmethionine:tRNA ribosyltransferase-isomerase
VRIRAGDFDYPLDESLIAQEPLARRDQSRLMVLGRGDGRVEHHVFSDLPALLRKGDLLAVNQTLVVPARFACRRKSGGRIEGLFLRELAAGHWEVMLKGAGRCKLGDELPFENAGETPPGGDGRMPSPPPATHMGETPMPHAGDAALRLVEDLGGGRWRVAVAPAVGAMELLGGLGQSPLPPYIRRRSRDREELDRTRYQTVYASVPGAVAAPAAGLHFTPELLARLGERGIQIARLTLHVGLGTFQPVKVEDLSRHSMHSEWYDLPAPAADALNAARREGRRIVAVGTTSLRVLETVAGGADRGGQCPPHFSPQTGWTDIFIYPPYQFRAAGALITNFHLPRSTLLMLVAAFCSPGTTDGIRVIMDAYAQAANLRYRFYSYGDAMLIE